ncbi:MAG TPA: hypothetical protein PLK76_01890 [bacterium]|nr:hypothetical protein [bacterium]
MQATTRHKIFVFFLKSFKVLAAVAFCIIIWLDDATGVGQIADPAESFVGMIAYSILSNFIRSKKMSWGMDDKFIKRGQG